MSLARALTICGVSYLVYWALKPGEANASTPSQPDVLAPPVIDVTGVGPILRPENNRRPGLVTPNDALAIINSLNGDGWHDPRDVLATIMVESAFNPAAYRYEAKLGEASYGLMQLLWSTARQMLPSLRDPTELYDPATNIQAGMMFMRWNWDYLRRRLGRDPSNAEWLGAYNAGVGNVMKGYIPNDYIAKHATAKAALTLA